MMSRECVIEYDDDILIIVEKFNKVLGRVGKAFAMIEPMEDNDSNVTYRLITQGTDEWGYFNVQGYIPNRPLTKEERQNIS